MNLPTIHSFKHNPSRDWSVILAVVGVIFILLFTYAVLFFRGIERGELFSSPQLQNVAEQRLKKDDMKDTLAGFEARAIEVADIKSGGFYVDNPF